MPAYRKVAKWSCISQNCVISIHIEHWVIICFSWTLWRFDFNMYFSAVALNTLELWYRCVDNESSSVFPWYCDVLPNPIYNSVEQYFMFSFQKGQYNLGYQGSTEDIENKRNEQDEVRKWSICEVLLWRRTAFICLWIFRNTIFILYSYWHFLQSTEVR